jgi:hypothetical protein
LAALLILHAGRSKNSLHDYEVFALTGQLCHRRVNMPAVLSMYTKEEQCVVIQFMLAEAVPWAEIYRTLSAQYGEQCSIGVKFVRMDNHVQNSTLVRESDDATFMECTRANSGTLPAHKQSVVSSFSYRELALLEFPGRRVQDPGRRSGCFIGFPRALLSVLFFK